MMSINPKELRNRISAHSRFGRGCCGELLLALAALFLSAGWAQAATFILGTTNLVVGPAAGTNSVVLGVTPGTATWTATANANWLHFTAANQGGTGSTNVIFSFDANPGPTRSGALALAGQTLTVTQAGSTYIAVSNVVTVFPEDTPCGVAVDQSGNLYVGTSLNDEVLKWTLTNNTLTAVVQTPGRGIAGHMAPMDVAVDRAGNVYFCDYDNGAINEWSPENGITTLISALAYPLHLALDPAGNLYFADPTDTFEMWSPTTRDVVTLVSNGLNNAAGLATDILGNVYVSDSGTNAVDEWSPVTHTFTTLFASPLNNEIAVDGGGNIYYSDNEAIMERTPWNNAPLILTSSPVVEPYSFAADSAGNVYVGELNSAGVVELPHAFVDPTPKFEGTGAGSDELPVVVPSTANLLPPFVPTSDQAWLSVTGITNGVVSFSFAPIVGPTRTAHISLFGQPIPVTQVSPATNFSLSTNAFVGGAAAGNASVALTVSPAPAPWQASANASWLHLTGANQAGIGSTNVTFSFDANAGALRSGTLTIAGQTLTVTQRGIPLFFDTYSLLEGPMAGSDSVVLPWYPSSNAWTAAANANWLHIAAGLQTGTNSTNVLFNYDANPGATRSGTLTLGDYAVTVTQAGSTYVSARPWVTLIDQGSRGVAVDSSGNVYCTISSYNPDYSYTGDVYEWSIANNTVSRVAYWAAYHQQDVAIDRLGNFYFADPQDNVIFEWMPPANGSTSNLASTGLVGCAGVAVDGLGDVYIADTGDNAIKDITPDNSTLSTIVSAGLTSPSGVAADGSGNLYIADTGDNAIKEWIVANNTLITLVNSNLSSPSGLAVDGSGNVYIADTGNNAIKVWNAASNKVSTLASSPLVSLVLNQPLHVAVDGSGDVYIADTGNQTTEELARAFVDTSDRLESLAAGNDSLPVVLPAMQNLLAPFAPYSDSTWLTISGVTNGVVAFAFTASSSNRTGHIVVLGQSIPVTQGGPAYSIGTTNLLEGAGAGSDSVVVGVVPTGYNWTASANATWLHLNPANQRGSGSTNVVFSYDANPGATRSGTLAIGGQTLTVTQAGSTYVRVGPVTTLPVPGSDLTCVAVDSRGNVYGGASYLGGSEYEEIPYAAIYEWTPSNDAGATVFNAEPYGVVRLATDHFGNFYFSQDTEYYFLRNPGIYEVSGSNAAVTSLVSSGVVSPAGLVVDGGGKVYIADGGTNAVEVWTPANSNLTALVSTGLSNPQGVALDAAGNVYIADTGNNAIKEWVSANNTVVTLISSNLSAPQGVAVDGSGNVYVADTGNSAIKEWNASSNTVSTLISSGLNGPGSVAVDAVGNVYICDDTSYVSAFGENNGVIKELPRAFVNTNAIVESLAAGSDALPPVLPPTESLMGPFTPSLGAPWLNFAGLANGSLYFSFSAASSNRTGYIAVLGQIIPISQGAETFVYSFGKTNYLEGPNAGIDNIPLEVSPYFGTWTAQANASWLHLSVANQGGTGSGNIVFTFDANPGATRTGTLTVGSQMLTVTQAGSSYVPASDMAVLATLGQGQPYGVAVDGAGNVYMSDFVSNALYKWSVASNTLTTLVSTNLDLPDGVAVDGAGNVYAADDGDATIKKWTAANKSVTALVAPTYLTVPVGVAVDASGNVYISDSGGGAIRVWTAPNYPVITLLYQGLSYNNQIALDAFDDVYIADTGNNDIKELTATGVSTLVSGLSSPNGVAVDGSGNIYIAAGSIFKWTAANSNLTTLVGSGLNNPNALAVDGAGNIYIADTFNNAIKEIAIAFVDATPKLEGAAAGSDSLPAVLPGTENLLDPFMPTSDQPWLTITGVTNGVVSYSFTATTSNRTAHVTVLGQSVPVMQSALTFTFATNVLFEGPNAGSDSAFLEVSLSNAAWTASANVAWLHLSLASQSGTGSENLAFTYDANPAGARSGSITVEGQTLTIDQSASVVSLGATTFLEGPQAGSDSVVLAAIPSTANWTATPNASWLHLNPANQNGTGSTNVVFSYDANSGATRVGTFSCGGQMVTITQAGSPYVAAGNVTALVSAGLSAPHGLAVNAQGAVYFADTFDNAIKLWTVASNSAVPVASGLNSPVGVAVDGAGNVYFADSGNDAVKVLNAASGNVTTLISSGLNSPEGVAVDGMGNVYVADTGNGAIKKWAAASNSVTALVSAGLSYPAGVAVDAAGNVYIADTGNNAIKEWTANGNLTTLISSGLSAPEAVAVDGGGNLYIADTGNGAIKRWTAASNTVILAASSGLSYPYGVAVDASDNIYIADTDGQAIKELPRAFVNPAPKQEGLTAGTDSLPMVLPDTANLLPPFAPTSSQPWLFIAGTSGGVVTFSFTATVSNRAANIALLGQTIPVTQAAILTPPNLYNVRMLSGGVIQFGFTNIANASFTVVSSTNLATPFTNWTATGMVSNIAPGVYQFTSQPTTNDMERFYGIRSP